MNEIPHRCRDCRERNPWPLRVLIAIVLEVGLILCRDLVFKYPTMWMFVGYIPYVFCLVMQVRWMRVHHPRRRGVTWAPRGSVTEHMMLSRRNWWQN